MNSAKYYKAAVPEPWTILGLDLRPFSAGHIILLNRVESPLVGAADDHVTWLDLALACAICSKTFQDGAALLNEPDLAEQLGKLLEQRNEGDLAAKVAEFMEYVNEGSECPDYLYEEGGSAGDVPAVQSVKVYLMGKLHISEADFLDRSWSLSLWDMITSQAQEGHLKLCSEETISEAQDVAAKLQKLVEEGKLQCRS